MKKTALFIVILGVILLIQPMSAQTWLATKRLTWNFGTSEAAATSTDSNNWIHVVWCDYTPGNFEIFYRKSTDGGAVWTPAKRLTWNSGFSQFSDIAVDSNDDIHVVWQENTPGNEEICYKKSTNGGSSWVSTKRLTFNLEQSLEPAIATDSSNNVHVVWYNDTDADTEIFYKKSTDGGSSWSFKRMTWNSGYSNLPDIVADSNNNIYVCWKDRESGSYQIYYKKSTNAGTTWGATKRLTWTSGTSDVPALTADSNNNIIVTWQDNTPGVSQIYFKKSTDGGTSWTGQRIAWTAGSSVFAAVAADANNNIHIVWQDSTHGKYEIYYKRSTNGGTTWTTKRLTWNAGNSYWPDIAVDSLNRIHVVWDDHSISNWEIFYRKGIQ